MQSSPPGSWTIFRLRESQAKPSFVTVTCWRWIPRRLIPGPLKWSPHPRGSQWRRTGECQLPFPSPNHSSKPSGNGRQHKPNKLLRGFAHLLSSLFNKDNYHPSPQAPQSPCFAGPTVLRWCSFTSTINYTALRSLNRLTLSLLDLLQQFSTGGVLVMLVPLTMDRPILEGGYLIGRSLSNQKYGGFITRSWKKDHPWAFKDQTQEDCGLEMLGTLVLTLLLCQKSFFRRPIRGRLGTSPHLSSREGTRRSGRKIAGQTLRLSQVAGSCTLPLETVQVFLFLQFLK